MLCITTIGIDQGEIWIVAHASSLRTGVFVNSRVWSIIPTSNCAVLHHPQQLIRQMGGLTCTRPLRPNGSRHLPALQREFKHRCPAITRRRCVSIKAFRSDSEGVMLPMDAYRVSGFDLHPQASLKHASSVISIRNHLTNEQI